jgi:chromosome partitioning protein
LGRLALALEREPAERPVLMDACPMLGVLSLSSIFAADGVLIPISADYLAMKGAVQMERTLKALEQVLKRRVPRRYLITRYDVRRRMAVDIDEARAPRHEFVRRARRECQPAAPA